MRRVESVFLIIIKVRKYLKNIDEMTDSNDPEAVPMADHQGHVNDLFAISYKTGFRFPAPDGTGRLGTVAGLGLSKRTILGVS